MEEGARPAMSIDLPQKIMVAVDGSDTSSKAAAYAVKLAGLLHSNLTGIHVILLPPHASAETLEKLRKELKIRAVEVMEEITKRGKAGDVQVECKIIETNRSVVQSIIESATQLEANLIVIGTRGTSGVGKMLLGSVAAGVVSSAPCPVLAVR